MAALVCSPSHPGKLDVPLSRLRLPKIKPGLCLAAERGLQSVGVKYIIALPTEAVKAPRRRSLVKSNPGQPGVRRSRAPRSMSAGLYFQRKKHQKLQHASACAGANMTISVKATEFVLKVHVLTQLDDASIFYMLLENRMGTTREREVC